MAGGEAGGAEKHIGTRTPSRSQTSNMQAVAQAWESGVS